MTRSAAAYTIALAGQPNVGKSTIFNLLTGQSQYVSNWPGKTCEQKTALVHHSRENIYLIDLPGVYSLTADSEEERIARDCIIRCQPDAIIVIVDASALERDLYLVAELLQLSTPLVIGLNRLDQAQQHGLQIEPHVLEAALGLPVIPMIANQGQGVDNLVNQAIHLATEPDAWKPNRPEIRADHQQVLKSIESLLDLTITEPYTPSWAAIKLLEGDEEITQLTKERLGEKWEAVHKILLQHDDAFLAVASGRYEWIARMIRAAVIRPKAGRITITDRIDRIATHPFLGLLILIGALGFLFWLIYAIGVPIQTWMDTEIVQASAQWVRLQLANSPAWLASMISDGAIAGVGTVLTLLPILLVFFIVLGILEDIGYMARAAFVMDRFMHAMGLHGKSFLPLFLGFGCNVPAVMGSRIIESPKARLITILVAPIVPCTARMSVIAFLAPIFFMEHALWVSWGMVALSLGVLMIMGIILHELFLGGEHNAFIMELPLYQSPDWKVIGQGVWQRTVDFLHTAGTIILLVSLIMWALSTFPSGDIETSYLAMVGRLFAPIGAWMGLEWQMMVALLSSFLRKENTIPTLAVLYSAGQNASLAQVLADHLLPAAALAFMAVQVLFIPCLATLATIKQETNSWKWTILSTVMLLVISLGIGVLIYQGARLIGWGV